MWWFDGCFLGAGVLAQLAQKERRKAMGSSVVTSTEKAASAAAEAQAITSAAPLGR